MTKIKWNTKEVIHWISFVIAVLISVALYMGIVWLIWITYKWIIPLLWEDGPLNIIDPEYNSFLSAWATISFSLCGIIMLIRAMTKKHFFYVYLLLLGCLIGYLFPLFAIIFMAVAGIVLITIGITLLVLSKWK